MAVDDLDAHTLTLEFGRFLTEEEWRTVVDQVRAHVPHVQQLRANAVPPTVHVGDTMRFDTALLRQIHDEPDHRSRLVRVERITREQDGSLQLLLQNAGTTELDEGSIHR